MRDAEEKKDNDMSDMIKSLQKATRLLSILADSYDNPVPLSVLSYKAGINKSTCSHIIATLENEGYAIKISNSKGYILGPAAYCLSRFGKYKNELIAICHPIMQYIYSNLGYSVLLAVIESDTKYIIDYIDNGKIFKTKTIIHTDDIYRTATGQAILANLPTEKVHAVVKKYGLPSSNEWIETVSFKDLLNYISSLKKDSVFKSSSLDNANKNLCVGYGCPIFNSVGCVGALGIAVNIPADKETGTPGDEDNIVKILKLGAKEANRRLAHKS